MYNYVLLREPRNGVIGMLKVISTHSTPQDLLEHYKVAEATNKNCRMCWNETGKWVAIRTLDSDTDGTIDIVKFPEDEEEEFMGEKIPKPVRENMKKNDTVEAIKDRAAMDHYKDRIQVKLAEEKKIQLKQQAMKELQAQLDDPKSLTSYTQLQWKRLQQKSAIAEYRKTVEEAQKALMKTIKELHVRTRAFPHYENLWQPEARRLHALLVPKKPLDNPIDTPIANIGEEDDLELAEGKLEDVEDAFDTGVGVDVKGKAEKDDYVDNEKVDKAEYLAQVKKTNELQEKLNKTQEEINKSFLPEAPIKKLGPKGKKDKKKDKKKR